MHQQSTECPKVDPNYGFLEDLPSTRSVPSNINTSPEGRKVASAFPCEIPTRAPVHLAQASAWGGVLQYANPIYGYSVACFCKEGNGNLLSILHCIRECVPGHCNIPRSFSQFIVTHFTKMLLPGGLSQMRRLWHVSSHGSSESRRLPRRQRSKPNAGLLQSVRNCLSASLVGHSYLHPRPSRICPNAPHCRTTLR